VGLNNQEISREQHNMVQKAAYFAVNIIMEFYKTYDNCIKIKENSLM
jgi:hypothetical protein